MPEKKTIKVGIFWLSVACTEIILYIIMLVGVSIVCYGVFKSVRVLPVVIVTTMIDILSIWRKYMRGTYAESYRELVLKEEAL